MIIVIAEIFSLKCPCNVLIEYLYIRFLKITITVAAIRWQFKKVITIIDIASL